MVKITRKSTKSLYPPITIEIEFTAEESEMFDYIWRYCGDDAVKGPQSIATHIPLWKFEDFRKAMWDAFSSVLSRTDC